MSNRLTNKVDNPRLVVQLPCLWQYMDKARYIQTQFYFRVGDWGSPKSSGSATSLLYAQDIQLSMLFAELVISPLLAFQQPYLHPILVLLLAL